MLGESGKMTYCEIILVRYYRLILDDCDGGHAINKEVYHINRYHIYPHSAATYHCSTLDVIMVTLW